MGWQQRTDNNKFFVSTTNRFLNGAWETLVFPVVNGAVDYLEVDGASYNSAEEAARGHDYLFAKWNSVNTKEDQERITHGYELNAMPNQFR